MNQKKIVVVSHCVLNQNSVINDWERARGAFPFSELFIKEGVGIIQLPCPELIFNGINRPPLSYLDYNTSAYRKLCRDLLVPYINQLEMYLENGYEFIGVIGINRSPTCSISDRRGVLMEELFLMAQNKRINVSYAEVPETYDELNEQSEFIEKIIRLIRRKDEE